MKKERVDMLLEAVIHCFNTLRKKIKFYQNSEINMEKWNELCFILSESISSSTSEQLFELKYNKHLKN